MFGLTCRLCGFPHGAAQESANPRASACGARKANCFEAPASNMYVGSYHRAARRAADAITTPGTKIMILSAAYGLLDLDDVIMRYERRLGQRYAITAQGLREQAEQLGLTDTPEVVVLAPAAYADLATHVWPHAHRPLAGTRGIGDQMARFTALATGRTTVADLLGAAPATAMPATSRPTAARNEHTVSIRGGQVHLAATPPGRAAAVAPVCPATSPAAGGSSPTLRSAAPAVSPSSPGAAPWTAGAPWSTAAHALGTPGQPTGTRPARRRRFSGTGRTASVPGRADRDAVAGGGGRVPLLRGDRAGRPAAACGTAGGMSRRARRGTSRLHPRAMLRRAADRPAAGTCGVHDRRSVAHHLGRAAPCRAVSRCRAGGRQALSR